MMVGHSTTSMMQMSQMMPSPPVERRRYTSEYAKFADALDDEPVEGDDSLEWKFFASFHESVLQRDSSTDLQLFPQEESQLLDMYEQHCFTRMKELEALGHSSKNQARPLSHQDIETYREVLDVTLEFKTWKLLNKLLFSDPLEQLHDENLFANKDAVFWTHDMVLKRIFKDDDVAKKHLRVVEWLEQLHEIFSDRPLEPRPLRESLGANGKRFDPDAPVREGKKMGPVESDDVKNLISCVWHHLRIGRLEEGLDICRKCNDSWRAASLSGGFPSREILRRHPSFTSLPEEVTSTLPEGNKGRNMWVKACMEVVNKAEIPMEERALYAVLVGAGRDVVRRMCVGMEDVCWAEFRRDLISRLHRELDGVRNSLKSQHKVLEEQMLFGVDVATQSRQPVRESSQIFKDIEMEYSRRDASEHDQISHQYFQVQMTLINQDYHSLLSVLGAERPMSKDWDRFATHLLLFLDARGKLPALEEPEALAIAPNATPSQKRSGLLRPECQSILRRYLDHLGGCEMVDAIAAYACRLREPVPALHAFLREISPKERERVMNGDFIRTYYKEDLDSIRTSVVESIISEAALASGDDQRKIDSVSLLFPRETSDEEAESHIEHRVKEYMRQCLTLMGQFILHDRLKACEKLIEVMRSDLPDANHPMLEDEEIEALYYVYNCWVGYLNAMAAFQEWRQSTTQKSQIDSERPQFPRSFATESDKIWFHQQESQWLEKKRDVDQSCSKLAMKSSEEMMAVLTSLMGFLLPELSRVVYGDETIAQLRIKCLPRLILDYQRMLIEEGYTEQCIDLCNYVVDDFGGFYRLLSQAQAAEFLELIRGAVLLAEEQGTRTFLLE